MRATMEQSQAESYERAELGTLLAAALEEEVALLDRLRKVFVAQREALIACDPAALDDGVFAATRVLRTLDEARRHRQGLTRGLTGSDVDFDEIDAVVTGQAARAVRIAHDRLRGAAAGLRGEVTMLRRILQVALTDNRRYLDVLLGEGAPGHSTAGYEAAGAAPPGSGDEAGAVLDRTV